MISNSDRSLNKSKINNNAYRLIKNLITKIAWKLKYDLLKIKLLLLEVMKGRSWETVPTPA